MKKVIGMILVLLYANLLAAADMVEVTATAVEKVEQVAALQASGDMKRAKITGQEAKRLMYSIFQPGKLFATKGDCAYRRDRTPYPMRFTLSCAHMAVLFEVDILASSEKGLEIVERLRHEDTFAGTIEIKRYEVRPVAIEYGDGGYYIIVNVGLRDIEPVRDPEIKVVAAQSP